MGHLVAEAPYLQVMAGLKVSGLPDNSYSGAVRYAETARELVEGGRNKHQDVGSGFQY